MTTGTATRGAASYDYAALRSIVAEAIGVGDLELTSALGRITETACSMIGCAAAMIVMRNEDGSLSTIAPCGDDLICRALGGVADAGGPADAVIVDGQTLRMPVPASLAEHDEPAPAPVDLIGVPIRAHGEVAGGLFLSAIEDGSVFDEDDEHAARVIATAAGYLVDRDRAEAQAQRRQRWLASSTELTRELVSGVHDDPMQVLVDRVLDLADADLAAVAMPSSDGSSVVVTSAAGERAHLVRHRVFDRSDSLADHVISTSEPVVVEDVSTSGRLRPLIEALGIGAGLHVPMVDATAGDKGALVLYRDTGRPAFGPDEVEMAATFASQMVLALELADARATRERTALFAERDRIARDLHDHVIQQLFAIGMTLQATINRVDEPTGERLYSVIDDLDSTILQIRSTIFRLTGPVLGTGATLRSRAETLIEEMGRIAPFTVGFEVQGPLDFGVSDTVADDVLAVLRETLTNATKHSGASRARVVIEVQGETITVVVRDDGRGMSGATRRSGLANLRARAVEHGGSMTIDSGTEGTTIRWTVPAGE